MDLRAPEANEQLDLQRFTSLWKNSAFRFASQQCNAVFKELAELYGGAKRFYHCGEHINQCLGKLDEASTESGYFPAVEAAIWFHDAVYTAGDPDNEKNSMVLFQNQTRNHFSDEFIEEVSGLIMATAHRSAPETSLEKLTVDIDLSSFSLPSEKFFADGINIRQEFFNLTDKEFVRGQSRFLQNLLDRSSIYSTDYFLEHYENRAQKNIQQLLENYAKQLRS